MTERDLRAKVNNYMDTYFELYERKDDLIGNNKSALATIDNMIKNAPKNCPLGDQIDNKLISYEMLNKGTETVRSFEVYQTGNYPVVHTNNSASLLEEEQGYARVRTKNNNSAGFINIAILLYGIINIGMIIAMSLLK